MTRRRLAAALIGLVSTVGVGLTGPAPAAAGDLDESVPVERVVIVSLPGVSWSEARRADMPFLDGLVGESAVGVLSSQIGRGPASTTAAYLTIGAGTRAVVPGIDTGVALDPDELHGGVLATDILRRRLGSAVPGIAYLPVGAALDANADSPYGAVPGTLGDALARAGITSAVIANADAAEGFPIDEPPPDGAFSRSAATALMRSDGIVPEGTVGRDLLLEDPDAPFGRRFSRSRVLGALDRSWLPDRREVVLLEASDLSRAAAYGSRSTPGQRVALRREALEDADALLGDVLERVDPRTDAVLVLSPVAPGGSGLVALRAPGVDPGLLRSATTRRAGYVLLADVAPTILTLVGEEPPTSIEGRPFAIEAGSGDRVGALIDQGVAARSRDDRLPVVVPVIIAALALLVVGVAAGERLPPRLRRALGPTAVGMLGVVPGTFLAGHIDDGRQGFGTYAAAVLVCAAAVGLVGWLVERRWPGTGILVGLGSILLVIGGDVLVGAPLQVNTVFGYSTAVAGRFAGLGNLGFALFSAAALTFAVALVERGGRRTLVVAGALLVVAVLIDGLPMLGADVGGVASMVPAFALTVMVLTGRTVRWTHLVASVAASFGAVVAFGLLDASRPPGSRTHLARLGEHVVNRRFTSVADTLLRRVHASFGSTDVAVWLLALALVAAAGLHAAVVARGGSRWLDRLRPQGAPATALAIGLGALAVLGLVVNDSSIAVPATMLIVIVPVLVSRRLPSWGSPPDARERP